MTKLDIQRRKTGEWVKFAMDLSPAGGHGHAADPAMTVSLTIVIGIKGPVVHTSLPLYSLFTASLSRTPALRGCLFLGVCVMCILCRFEASPGVGSAGEQICSPCCLFERSAHHAIDDCSDDWSAGPSRHAKVAFCPHQFLRPSAAAFRPRRPAQIFLR